MKQPAICELAIRKRAVGAGRAATCDHRREQGRARARGGAGQAGRGDAEPARRRCRRILTISAPIAGQVTTRVAALGENFSAGAPLFSLIDMNNLWFTFNLREDLLGGLKIGDTFDVIVPALKSQVVPVRVTMINVQGQYATWRATRATGDFDLRTFEVRAVPRKPVDGLRPGMSAIVAWTKRGRLICWPAARIRPGFWLVFWREIDWLRRRPFLLASVTHRAARPDGAADRRLQRRAWRRDCRSPFSISTVPICRARSSAWSMRRRIRAVAVRVGELAEGRRMILSGEGPWAADAAAKSAARRVRRPPPRGGVLLQHPDHDDRQPHGARRERRRSRRRRRDSPVAADGSRDEPIEEAPRPTLQPIPVQIHALFNPTLNYVYFLLAAMLPERAAGRHRDDVGLFGRPRCRNAAIVFESCARLGGGLWPAMAGKLLPYTILFLLVLGLSGYRAVRGFWSCRCTAAAGC